MILSKDDEVDEKNSVQLEEEIFQLQFNLGRSIRYHSRRRKFFDFWDKLNSFCSLIFSSTATYGLLSSSQEVVIISGAVVTILSSLSLVIVKQEITLIL